MTGGSVIAGKVITGGLGSGSETGGTETAGVVIAGVVIAGVVIAGVVIAGMLTVAPGVDTGAEPPGGAPDTSTVGDTPGDRSGAPASLDASS